MKKLFKFAIPAIIVGVVFSTIAYARINNPLISTAYEVPLTFVDGLTRTINSIANNLITGLAGGQTIIGGTGVTDQLILKGTSGNGTSASSSIQLNVGNNGATNGMTILNSGLVGLGTTAPTHSLTLPSTSTGIAIYNSADQITAYDKLQIKFSSNIAYINTNWGTGGGSGRSIRIGVLATANNDLPTSYMGITNSSAGGIFQFVGTTWGGDSFFKTSSGNGMTANNVNQSFFNLGFSVSQTSTAGYNALLLNPTELSVGSGAKNLILGQIGGVDRFKFDNNGNLSFGGEASKSVSLIRQTTASTAGNDLSILGSGGTSGGTDLAGGKLILAPGVSTGTGMSSIRLQALTRSASTGTTDNTLVDRFILPSRKYLTDNSVVGLFDIALGSNQTTGGTVNYTMHATNGTDYQSHSGIMNWSAVSKGTAITAGVGHAAAGSGLELDVSSTGSIADTFSAVEADAGKVTISVNANSDLTGSPVIWIEYTITNQGSTAITQL